MDRTEASDAFNAGSIPVGCIAVTKDSFRRNKSLEKGVDIEMSSNNKKKNHTQTHASGQNTKLVENAKDIRDTEESKAVKTTAEKQADPQKTKAKEQTTSKEHVTEKYQEAVEHTVDKLIPENSPVYRGVPKTVLLSIIKIGIPVVACIIVVLVIISLVNKKNATEEAFEQTETAQEMTYEALAECKDDEIASFITSYYQALADGDMETVQASLDYVDDVDLITYEKKSNYVESYNDIKCYTKSGLTDNSYFVYVSYNVKFVNLDTLVPGLVGMYVYTDDNGALKIDCDMDESVNAAMQLVAVQEDVVDLMNRVNAEYNEVVNSDEELSSFLTEFTSVIKSEVAVELAKVEGTEASTEETVTEAAETEQASETIETVENTIVNEQVKATDTVNVRSSDSENADKIGKVTAGTVLTRTEQKINGWSKVIYEGKEAYIKSDYLELIVSEAVGDAIGVVKAQENVNVRTDADTSAKAIGLASAGSSYNLLEDLGDWYKIDFEGKTGYVKAEYFEK